MREVKTEKQRTFTDVNSFKQFVSRTETVIETKIYGTVEDLNEVENVYVKRSPETEKFFPAWEDDAKYVIINKGKPLMYSKNVAGIPGARYYTHEFIVE